MFHPFGNETVSPPAKWHPEPNFRGTWSVLSSCLFTMFLCIWTAVHINLPEHKKEHRQWLRKCGWLLIGLLAPELVAWNAFEQRKQVKKLTRDMRELYRSKHGIHDPIPIQSWRQSLLKRWSAIRRARWLRQAWHKSKVFLLIEAEDIEFPVLGEWPTRTHQSAEETFWTDLHSWYVLMGGIAFDTSSAEKPFLSDGRERLVVSPKGILYLAKHWPQLLPKLTRGDIEDKSKSDGLAKLITCWQATWFCVQCIFRLTQGLSISLLELNVFGHAICALLIYVIWWSKPKDVFEPTTIVGEEANAVAARMCHGSPIGNLQTFDRYWRGSDKIWMSSRPHAFHEYSHESGCRVCVCNTSGTAYYELPGPTHVWCLHVGDSSWSIYTFNVEKAKYVAIDAAFVNRLSMLHAYSKGNQDLPMPNGESVRVKSPDWCIDGDFIDDRFRVQKRYIIGITTACALYGGLHTTAWLSPFPSRAQQLLWRASSISVTSSGLAFLVFCLIMAFSEADPIKNIWYKLNMDNSLIEILLTYSVFSVIFAACLWYCICRAFLVVESIINLAHLSERDLRSPNWPAYIPHIS